MMGKKLFWIDLEMTGLDPGIHHIVEVAAIVTDENLNPLETYEQVVFQPPYVMEAMDPWCVKQHGISGLTHRVPHGVPLAEVEVALCQLIQNHFPQSKSKKERAIIAGNTIYQDRKFIEKYMKRFDELLHYRMLDVTSFKIVFESFHKYNYAQQKQHRALSDIEESIKEFKHYLARVHPDHGAEAPLS